MKRLKNVFLILFLIFTSLSLAFLGYFFAVTKNVHLDENKLNLPKQNVILYNYQSHIFQGENEQFKQTVSFQDLPTHTVSAFVCTEDKRFFSHNGFDLKRILKAAYLNAKSHSFQQGASTISQQLVKNTHLTQEKTWKRKFQEWKLTRVLEKKYSKEEIFEKYVNAIYFGHNLFGIHAATNFYFNKTPQELDLAESAILAGLVKSPNNYSPFKNATLCQKRKETVLNLMLKNKAISQLQWQNAIKQLLPNQPTKQEKGYSFSHRVFDELSTIAEEKQIKLGGKIEVYTAFHPQAQAETERIFKTHKTTNQTLCVFDVQNRLFKAYYSDLDEPTRQIGSLIKPLLVYAPAIEKDIISPATPLLDEKINFSGYAPSNHDHIFRGYVSAREALSKSLNVPTVKLLNSLGLQSACEYMEKMGLSIPNEDKSLAIALGGMKNGFSFTNVVSAYATLTNGEFSQGGFIEKIKINGQMIYQKQNAAVRVFSQESAYLTTDILKTAAQSGTAKKLKSCPFALAAKTGTVGTEKGNTDAYAVSYTSCDVVGCWLGNADNTRFTLTGGGAACNQIYALNNALFSIYQKQKNLISPFPIPPQIQTLEIDKTLYYDTHSLYLADPLAPPQYKFQELFKKSASPLKTSDLFTNPHINEPILSFEQGKVHIHFNDNSPKFYDYEIKKYNYATHKLLYQGEFLPIFTDSQIEKGNRYIYTITPIFQGRKGTTITLPEITTNHDESFPIQDKIISNKEWWDY